MLSRMITRATQLAIEDRLRRFPAVALVGPRQVGKTTLALDIAATRPSVYLDLEDEGDLAKLDDPAPYLDRHADELVVLDEIHRVPGLFPSLRGIIDRGRRTGRRHGRFLILGSASLDLLRQSGESLAGRIAFIELPGISVLEAPDLELEQHFSRGGFPESLLAPDDRGSFLWRRDFVRTYLERDIPQFGPRIPGETMRRLWTMLAHRQCSTLNVADLARGLGIDATTVARYLDLLADLLLVRRLPPLVANVEKRLVRSPRIILRDSGLVHVLLRITDQESLLSHPVVGASWEGFVLENLLSSAPESTLPSFYRTHAGAEIDLVLDLPGAERWAIEVKRRRNPRLERGFHHARADVQPTRCFAVHTGTERFSLRDGVEAIPLRELCRELERVGPR